MCKYGGAKWFNYGGISGSQSWCRYPRIDRAVFPMLGKTLECPLHRITAVKTAIGNGA